MRIKDGNMIISHMYELKYAHGKNKMAEIGSGSI